MVRFITVNQEDETLTYAADVEARAKKHGIRVHVDNSNESVGKKIRAAELAKVPYTVVLGEKEIRNSQLTPRIRKDMVVIEAPVTIGLDEFLGTVVNETKGRVLKTSL